MTEAPFSVNIAAPDGSMMLTIRGETAKELKERRAAVKEIEEEVRGTNGAKFTEATLGGTQEEKVKTTDQTLCPECQTVMKYVKAGIARKTGRKYPAFYSCPNCKKTQNAVPFE